MTCLIDTNVALRWVQRHAPEHLQAVQAIHHLMSIGVEGVITSQNLAEFWSVATRPVEANGLNWSVDRTRQAITDLESLFKVLHESERVYHEWKRLVHLYRVSGRQVYDARLAAFVCAYDTDWLLTFNVDDFRRYAEIQVVHPQEAVQRIRFGV
ncbi:MAG: type II toxin-antitoxin system VapC family toxin [Fimbriimonadales bacterium]